MVVEPYYSEYMKNIFSDSGVLAENLPHYEPRSGQRAMAKAIAELLRQEKKQGTQDQELSQAHCLIVEAGTGLGKTLAYLIPAALSGKKVVVSTNTRNLQDQILQREIPFLQNTKD
ncbi:MAG: DEAD/DEAH box helicase, partial [Candidatus Electrothrix sp. MAN1_4]|nr:DEAD/DEAH box helicase [Candidatus Electrothrix sp. MAN1_4]